MDMLIDAFNVIFLFVGLYFTLLFIMLFTTHEKRIFKKPSSKSFPSISIIIPAHNEERDIASTIEAVKNMSYPKRKEILVVDDGSTDKTYEIAKGLGVTVLRKKQGGKASALNFGIKHANGEIVVCIDSDSYPDKNALLKSVPFFDKGVASVTTSVLVKNVKCLLEGLQEIEYAMIAWSRKLFEYIDAIYVTPGAMSLYKKDALVKVGGFDEKNITEDIEIAWRLLKNNYKIKMALDAKVYTNVPKTMKGWWHQRIRWNIGGIQTTIKYCKYFRKKEFGSIGTFLLPLFSISYILSFAGLVFIAYSLFTGIRYLLGSFAFGFNPLATFFLYFNPDVFLLLMLINILITVFYLRLNVRVIKGYTGISVRLKYLLLYAFVYICVFPFNLVHSSIKYLTKRYEW